MTSGQETVARKMCFSIYLVMGVNVMVIVVNMLVLVLIQLRAVRLARNGSKRFLNKVSIF
jgi:hypothetical protein